MSVDTKPNFEEFNKFQTYFYTDIDKFNSFTNFEIRRNSVALLTNIGKEFPKLAMDILGIYSADIKGIESPAVIKALQRAKFITGFSTPRVPQYIYYKNLKPKTVKKKATVKRKTKKGLEFTEDIIEKIQSILFYDSKDYELFKYSEQVQYLGKQIMGEVINEITKKNVKTKN